MAACGSACLAPTVRATAPPHCCWFHFLSAALLLRRRTHRGCPRQAACPGPGCLRPGSWTWPAPGVLTVCEVTWGQLRTHLHSHIPFWVLSSCRPAEASFATPPQAGYIPGGKCCLASHPGPGAALPPQAPSPPGGHPRVGLGTTAAPPCIGLLSKPLGHVRGCPASQDFRGWCLSQPASAWGLGASPLPSRSLGHGLLSSLPAPGPLRAAGLCRSGQLPGWARLSIALGWEGQGCAEAAKGEVAWLEKSPVPAGPACRLPRPAGLPPGGSS